MLSFPSQLKNRFWKKKMESIREWERLWVSKNPSGQLIYRISGMLRPKTFFWAYRYYWILLLGIFRPHFHIVSNFLSFSCESFASEKTRSNLKWKAPNKSKWKHNWHQPSTLKIQKRRHKSLCKDSFSYINYVSDSESQKLKRKVVSFVKQKAKNNLTSIRRIQNMQQN